MFRTIKLEHPNYSDHAEMVMQFRNAVQIVLSGGFENNTFNKNTYRKIKEELRLRLAFLKTTSDTAFEPLKATKFWKRLKRKSLIARHDRRVFNFYPDSHTISITTVKGSLVFQALLSSAEHEKFKEYKAEEFCKLNTLLDNEIIGNSGYLILLLANRSVSMNIYSSLGIKPCASLETLMRG